MTRMAAWRLALRAPLYVFIMGLLAGCASVSATTDTTPFFEADPGELARYEPLARKREQQLETCEQQISCANAHFTRALIALFEDRQLAHNHFQRVVDFAPSSPQASSSEFWIKVLEDGHSTHAWNEVLDTVRVGESTSQLHTSTTQHLVRDVLQRELFIDQLVGTVERSEASLRALRRRVAIQNREIDGLKNQEQELSGKTPSHDRLAQEIVNRDKKIEELNSQLEALKQIDRELRKHGR